MLLMARASLAGQPVIRAVEGIGAKMYATLEMDNGNLIDVQAGDLLANGMKVVAIAPGSVTVETAKRRRLRLSSAISLPAAFNPGYLGPGLNLPPLRVPAAVGSAR